MEAVKNILGIDHPRKNPPLIETEFDRARFEALSNSGIPTANLRAKNAMLLKTLIEIDRKLEAGGIQLNKS